MKILKEEILYEMSRVANMSNMDASIWVHPSQDRNGPYFKIYNSIGELKATKCARIRFDIPKYETHKEQGKRLWKLTKSEIRELMEFFNSGYKKENYTYWDRCKWMWNEEIFSNMGIRLVDDEYFSGKCDTEDVTTEDKNYLRLDLKMPDYLTLE